MTEQTTTDPQAVARAAITLYRARDVLEWHENRVRHAVLDLAGYADQRDPEWARQAAARVTRETTHRDEAAAALAQAVADVVAAAEAR